MHRREFLQRLAMFTAGAPFWSLFLSERLWAKLPSGVKMTGVKTFRVDD